MTAKTSPARVAAFLQAVRETGNQTLACERAKVSRSWVQLWRSTDPAFREAVAEAVATAKVRLADGDGVRPARGWRVQAGEELVVRGTNGRRAQVARARLRQWTPRVEARFLAVLSRCANVRAACAHVGLSIVSAYNHRARWPDFAARWEAAVEEGQVALEADLLAAAGRCLGTGGTEQDDAEPPITGMTADHALQLLRMRGRPFGHGIPMRLPTSDEVDRKIMRLVARFERVRAWREQQAGAKHE